MRTIELNELKAARLKYPNYFELAKYLRTNYDSIGTTPIFIINSVPNDLKLGEIVAEL